MEENTNLPTHVEEIDGLRLQVAKLKLAEASRLAHDAITAANKAEEAFTAAMKTASEKYQFDPDKDFVAFDTWEIQRAK